MVEFDQMWFIFQHNYSLPCGPHTSFILCCSAWIPLIFDIEALILILAKVLNCRYMTSSSVRYCFPAAKKGFSCWGTENSQMVPNQENMEADQPVRIHSHAQQPLQVCNHRLVCRSIVLVKQDSLRQFLGRSEMSLVLFKVLSTHTHTHTHTNPLLRNYSINAW